VTFSKEMVKIFN